MRAARKRVKLPARDGKTIEPGHCVDTRFSYQTSEGTISQNTAFSHTKADYITITRRRTRSDDNYTLYVRPSLVGDIKY